MSRAAASSQESRPESLLAPKNNTCRQRIRCTKVVGPGGAIYLRIYKLGTGYSSSGSIEAILCKSFHESIREKILVIHQASCYNRERDGWLRISGHFSSTILASMGLSRGPSPRRRVGREEGSVHPRTRRFPSFRSAVIQKGERPMQRPSYSQRDYAFGQAMLTLRTSMGLTQTGLAELLHISRRAVTEWEAGGNYPKAVHLQQLIALGVQHQAFPVGREAAEIRRLWKAAHQKVVLDEEWLSALLGQKPPLRVVPVPLPGEESRARETTRTQPAPRPRVDWGDALALPSFYGREPQLAQLSHC